MIKTAVFLILSLVCTQARSGEPPQWCGGGSIGFVRLAPDSRIMGNIRLPGAAAVLSPDIATLYGADAGLNLPLGAGFSIITGAGLSWASTSHGSTQPVVFSVQGVATAGTLQHTIESRMFWGSAQAGVQWARAGNGLRVSVGLGHLLASDIAGTEAITSPRGITYVGGTDTRFSGQSTFAATAVAPYVEAHAFHIFPLGSMPVAVELSAGIRLYTASLTENAYMTPACLTAGIRILTLPAPRVDTIRTYAVLADTTIEEVPFSTDAPAVRYIERSRTHASTGMRTGNVVEIADTTRIHILRYDLAPQPVLSATLTTEFHGDSVAAVRQCSIQRYIITNILAGGIHSDTIATAIPRHLVLRARTIADSLAHGVVSIRHGADTLVRFTWKSAMDTSFIWDLSSLPLLTALPETTLVHCDLTVYDGYGQTYHAFERTITAVLEPMAEFVRMQLPDGATVAHPMVNMLLNHAGRSATYHVGGTDHERADAVRKALRQRGLHAGNGVAPYPGMPTGNAGVIIYVQRR